MATVSITSDLEPYLASLRMYLANDSRPSPEKDSKDDETCAGSTPVGDGAQKKRTKKNDDGKQLPLKRGNSRYD
ncbi:hypothetical protein PHISCL_01340 [Aspergillus sclerotialis]|uniref:Uncharacterized protein n=1 Tax=Aspergillus sclerotialis TaxID=2070753 RepID=A0A3A2ZYB8_9EURO|nr:hypothetical protein PHISCL_01340 [Aspergillus sclerotialis]